MFRFTVFALMLCLPVVLAAPVPKDPGKSKFPDTEDATPVAEADRAAGKDKSAENLKQIMIAVHNFASANRDHLVKNVGDKNGKVLLSWRVKLLPYLDEEALYKKFKLDEAWDSPHNIQLLEKMPKVFESPRVKVRKGYTAYQCFAGGVLGSPYNIGNIPDGTSNTIWCAEITAAVPWTKPADAALERDANKDPFKFGKAFGQKPLAALCDGVVRDLDSMKLKHETLKNAIGPDEGQVLGADW